MCALENENGELIPKVKFSDNVGKITLPCFKRVWRLFDRATGKAIADVITLHDEKIDESQPYELFDPDHVWKRKTVSDFIARPLGVPVFEKGRRVCDLPDIEEIRAYCDSQVETIWDEVQRFENPHSYYVDLSQRLWDERAGIISNISGYKKNEGGILQ